MGKNAERCSLLKNGSESTRELLDGNSTLSKDRVTVVWRARGKAESREEAGEGGKRGCLRSQRWSETSGCGKVSEGSLGREPSGELYA